MKRKTRIAAMATALAAAAVVAVPTAASASGDGHRSEARCARQLDQANHGFDEAFFGRNLDAFMAYYREDATVIYFNGTRPYTKAEARENSTRLFADTTWTASFTVLRKTVQGCHSAQVIEDGHFTRAGTTYHFLVGLSWVRQHGRWQVALDQATALPAT